MDINMNGKRALVTGAGKGIGRAIAKQLAACGAKTFAVSRTMEDLQCLQSEIPEIHIIQLDISDWERTKEELMKIGPIDLLVNNAGVVKLIPFLEISKEDIKWIMDTNFTATFNISQIIANTMVDKGKGGSIVNISSIGSRNAFKNNAVYSSSKAAMDMLTKCMALELGPANIRVNTVNPTLVWTDMTIKLKDSLQDLKLMEETPLGRFAEIEDVVNTVMFLLSDKSKMISGESIRVDGGYGVN